MTDTTPPLSDREREILACVASGSTNQQIANDLGISVNTVKVHVRNIFSKIGVASRAEATLYAVRNGVISLDAADKVAAVAVADDDNLPINNGDAEPVAAVPTAPAASTTAPSQPSSTAISPSAAPRNRTMLWLGLALAALLIAGGAIAVLIQQGGVQEGTQPVAPTAPVLGSGSGPVVASPRPQWNLLKPLAATQQAAAGVAANGMVYVIGGSNGTSVTNALWEYNPDSDTWRARNSKPTAVQFALGAVLNGKIHVPGGETADGRISDVLEIYDPTTDSWSTAASMPAPRSGYGLVAFEGKLYLFGGWDGEAPTATVFVYNPDQDAWSEAPPMTFARAYGGAAAADERIYVMGGEGADGEPAMQGEIYDPVRAQWSPMASSMPAGITRFGIASLGEYIVLAGGEEINTPLYYNFRRDLWEIYPESAPLSGLGIQPAIATRDNVLYMLSVPPDVADSSVLYEMRVIYSMTLPFQSQE